jgi:uncharacterized protein (TIGR03083 family)
MPSYQPVEPVNALPLIVETRAELLRILNELTDDEWQAATVCTGWTVRDVVAHILGDDMGILSNLRDNDGQYHHIDGWEALVTFINAQNDLWVQATRRLSRRLLVDFLRLTGEQVVEFFATLDPDEPAGPIGWAGGDPDPRWLHIAREYTEYWMHHQHICEAVGKASLKEARYMHPLISTFIRALPFTYQAIKAPPDTSINVVFTGEGSSEWYLVRRQQAWQLDSDAPVKPQTTIALSTDTAWRLFTRNKPIDALISQIHITGDETLGRTFMKAKAFIG